MLSVNGGEQVFHRRCSKQLLRRSASKFSEIFKITDETDFEFREDIELQMLDGYCMGNPTPSNLHRHSIS